MILNIFYSLFFVGVNLLLYLKLQKGFQPRNSYGFYLFIIVVVIAHIGFIKNNFLMNTEDFFNISMFSMGLLILHFATNIQVELFKKYSSPQDERGQKLQSILLLVYDFMRQKLIYIMASISQVLDVWNEHFR